MAEPSRVLQNAKRAAVSEVEQLMALRPRTQRLDGPALSGGEIAGWRTMLDIGGNRVTVRVTLDVNFPFAPPRVSLEDRSFFLVYPHVEWDGKLCLNPSTATFSPSRPVEMVQETLDDAAKLLAESISGRNKNDFATEFVNYWGGSTSDDQRPVWSLLNEHRITRKVYYWPGSAFSLVADTEATLSGWLKRAFPEKSQKNCTFHAGVYLALPAPLLPEEYPKTNSDARQLALRADQNIDRLLGEITPQDSSDVLFVFGFDSPVGPVLAGVWIGEPVKPTQPWSDNKQRRYLGDGFSARPHSPRKADGSLLRR